MVAILHSTFPQSYMKTAYVSEPSVIITAWKVLVVDCEGGRSAVQSWSIPDTTVCKMLNASIQVYK